MTRLTGWREEQRTCPVCGGDEPRALGRRGGRAHHLRLGKETSIVRCSICDAVYASPTLLPVGNPYDEEQAENYFRIHDENRKVALGRELATFAEQSLQRTGAMLEVGCGRGELLEGAQQKGWRCHGVEMTAAYAALAAKRGIAVEVATAEACSALDPTAASGYDVILFAAVLEHLYDPMLVLRRAYQVLRPGGLVFIDVPNEGALAMKVGNLYQRVQGRNWSINLSPTFPPFHVVGFSPKSIRYALEHTGFELRRLDVIQYTNEVPSAPSLKRKLERLGMSLVQRAGRKLGMGDGLVCWARKPPSAPWNSPDSAASPGPPIA